MPDVRVLHVDDDESLLGLASTMLERRGFDVVTVTDVDGALDVLDSEPVDCVVSDYQMPGRNGLEFLELVRERDPERPFVLFTGKGSEEVASDAIAAGVTDYLQKRTDPSQFEELADRIEQAVRERRTAEGLSEGDRILSALVETLSGVVYRLRLPEERLTFLGGRVEELTGYGAASFREDELTWQAVTHEDDLEWVDREIGRALREGRSFDVTHRIRTASGRVRRVSNRGRGVYDGDGEPVAVEGFVIDRSDGAHEARVRELHAATRRLFAADSAEAVARLTAEAARDVLGYPVDCVRRYDADRDVLRVAASTGTDDDPMGERPDYPVDWDGDPMEASSYPATAFRTGTPVVVDEFGEADRPVRSGAVESAMYLPLGDHGTLSVGSAEPAPFDATDRELAGILAENATVALERAVREGTLEAERDRLSALFENIPDPTVRIEFEEGEPVVEAANPAFEETFGHPESAVVGRSLDDVVVPPDGREDARAYERIREDESRHAEVRRETVDGPRDFLLHLVPSARGAATGGYAIYTDVTERREHERELARQNERLEEFASIVSHDLRNPLNVAEGQLEIARATGASEAFDAVERAHDRMKSRIGGVLDLARHGRTVGETGAVDLAGTAREAWATVETGPARLDLEDGLPTVEADRERLCQLFENLFSNAVTHGTGAPTPESSARVAASGTDDPNVPADDGEAGEADAVGDATRGPTGGRDGGARRTPLTVTVGPLDDGFYVADDGVGLPAAERERVFDPGYSNVEGGTGFGLAIVRNVAEAHGWSVAATEGPDGGARFEFVGCETLDGDAANPG